MKKLLLLTCLTGLLGFAQSEEDMAAYMKFAMPGPHHQGLASMAGNWNIAGKVRMQPGGEWQESKSESVSTMILGGRFLNYKVKGDMMGMPFEGEGNMGYDLAAKSYVSTWMDSMGTIIVAGEGTCEEDHKVITFTSQYDDPVTKTKATIKTVYRIKSKDQFVMEMYMVTGDSEFMNMVLTHTRK